MFVQLDFSRSRPRRWRRLLPLALAALLLALPRLAALVPAAVALADRAIGAHYTARLDTLQRENFALHPASCRISRCSCREPRPAPAGKQRADQSPGLFRRGSQRGGQTASRWHAGCGHRAERAGRRRAVRGQRDRCGGRLLHRHLCRHRRAVRCVCRAVTPGQWVLTGPARRLCAGGRGHRDHPGRGLAGHTDRDTRYRCRWPDRPHHPDRHSKFVGYRIFCEKVIAFLSDSGYNSL